MISPTNMASRGLQAAMQGRMMSMIRGVLLNTTIIDTQRVVYLTAQRRLQSQDSSTAQTTRTFDEKLLEHLVCPLSKKDLRYDKEKNELVCDELGVAYPIVNGIPNLVPQDARMLKNDSSNSSQNKS